ncbi:MAG: class I SAM-dependent methyltransferase [Methanoregulaceae archaeon]|nr:class I SAM-dependent methyltransferase [Methanoregulaceae archaeon]
MDFFEQAYHGRPPWDIGRPQQEIVRIEESGQITGDVLDAGCGTGENALFLASRSHHVIGVDSVEKAIVTARKKAAERGLAVTFIVGDTLHLSEIGRTFDTVIDSGLFHTLSDPERVVFVRNLHDVLVPGGSYFMLAFSDLEPGGYGPRRITKQEVHDAFSVGWRINDIQAAVFESHTRKEGSRAWLSSITRL